MPCIVAFIVLGIMSIFSAAYRSLAKEAFDCVFRRVTLRPCNTGFQEKIKASFTAKFVQRAPWLARLINKYFELLSWVFIIITLASLFFAGRGLYNYYLYGSCNGLNDTGLCLLDPAGEHNKVSDATSICPVNSEHDSGELTMEGVDLSIFAQTDGVSEDQVLFIGCVSCSYSRQVYELVRQAAMDKKAKFVFAHYPVKKGTEYVTAFLDCAWKADQKTYWDLLSQLFVNEPETNASQGAILAQAADFGYSSEELAVCLELEETASSAAHLEAEVQKTHLYGTPLVFINSEILVGPKPERVYRRAFSGF